MMACAGEGQGAAGHCEAGPLRACRHAEGPPAECGHLLLHCWTADVHQWRHAGCCRAFGRAAALQTASGVQKVSHHEYLLEPALLCKQMTSSSCLRPLPLLGHVCPELSLRRGMCCELACFLHPSQMSLSNLPRSICTQQSASCDHADSSSRKV